MRPLPLLRHHFVSKRKYHMIIPMDVEWNKPVEDGVFDLQTHLLHGLIHCNGFGHLLCINGIEGGSKFLCGREIMDLWDRICTNLHARGGCVQKVVDGSSVASLGSLWPPVVWLVGL
ncbi:PHD finger protein MALE MEIOCYTE DEATH 1-like isoform X2 [Actinidia eriantha]|uniref:PHD finger protein MALE MEIOCYTE DEATH 1-like isoform X2 n=1 Tax=Actinidia eriantha TaxID=165200 RepID=UPI002582B600|nr:PHD finger protein MALE MEIOCYTE DEATH 1-like isoform X2 [Actinidia eriantha]